MFTLFDQIGKAGMIIPYYESIQGKGIFRKILSKAYTTIINLSSGHRLHYYNGLAVHSRYNVMRWHSNTRGFGFQADIIRLLLDNGFSYIEVSVNMVERKGGQSVALTFSNFLSVSYSIFDVTLRRLANWVYRE